MYKVLFVCTGNICRSPSAEGVFRSMVKQENLEDKIFIDSAGTIAYHQGEPPDRRAFATALKRGYDMTGQTARQALESDFEEFDIILAMDNSHLKALYGMMPEEGSKAKIELFLDFASNFKEKDVPDPYYGGTRGFERVLDMIEDGSKGLLDYIKKEHI